MCSSRIEPFGAFCFRVKRYTDTPIFRTRTPSKIRVHLEMYRYFLLYEAEGKYVLRDIYFRKKITPLLKWIFFGTWG